MIGDDIEIAVLRITGNAVKLGITAPSTTKVLRSEVLKDRGHST
jgi:carbon storage regulator CsrA